MARLAATGPRKAKAARQMRATAALLDAHHPEMMAGDHLRDAAQVLEHGSTDGAKRHLDAAMFMLTPQSLMRHGILDDDGHADAKHHMHQINRHRLAVEDIEDVRASNDRLRAAARAARGQPEPPQPFRMLPMPDTEPVAAARPPGQVIDLKSDAWKRERRDPMGEWMAGAFASMFEGQVKGKGPGLKEQARHTGLGKAGQALYRRYRKKGLSHEAAVMRARGLQPRMAAAAVGAYSNTGPAVHLAAWEHEARGAHGRWTGNIRRASFARGTQPGSFEHIREIEDLGDRAGIAAENPEIRSPTMRTALYNVARSVAQRDMKGARIHLESAKWANRHEARGRYTGELATLEHQLAQVPKEETGFQGRIRNPLSARAQHPGKYVSMRDRPPAHLNVGVRTVGYRAAELAGGPYRYRHGWIKLASAGSLHGKQVIGADDSGHQVLGTFDHPSGKVIPRHSSGMKVTRVRDASQADKAAVAAEAIRRRSRRGLFGLRLQTASLAGDPAAIQLSARTAMLQRTPAPLGRPGGPGLYHVKGMGHTPYFQQVVKALIEKRGMPKSKAYKIAWGALRKWRRGGGHVHPEVRAAATGALVGEAARGARAHMSHTADAWEVADVLIELAADPIELFNPYHAPTGQFTTASGAGQGQQGKAAKRKKLTREIASLHRQIAALRAQLPSRSRSRSPTPGKKGAAATSAKQARQAKQTAQKAGKPGAAAKARKPGMSPATIHAKIAALRATLQADIAELRALR